MKVTKIIPSAVAVISAFLISLFTIMYMQPMVSGYQLDQELKDNCKTYKLPATSEKNIQIDIDSEVVEVTPREGQEKPYELGKEIIRLPLKKTKSDLNNSECTSEARDILTEVQDVYQGYIKETCRDLESVVKGDVPLPTKNGIVANINGAEEFLNIYCVRK